MPRRCHVFKRHLHSLHTLSLQVYADSHGWWTARMRQLRVGELRPVQPASALEQPLGSPVFCCLLYAGAPIAAATARESQFCSSHRVLRYTDKGLQVGCPVHIVHIGPLNRITGSRFPPPGRGAGRDPQARRPHARRGPGRAPPARVQIRTMLRPNCRVEDRDGTATRYVGGRAGCVKGNAQDEKRTRAEPHPRDLGPESRGSGCGNSGLSAPGPESSRLTFLN